MSAIVAALGSKAGVVLAAGAAMLLTLATQRADWLTGTVDDALLGGAQVSANGGQLLPGAVSIVGAGLAGAVAAVTGRRWVRLVGLVVLVLTALALAVLQLQVLTAPHEALGAQVAAATARTGAPPTVATRTPAAYFSVTTVGLLLLSAWGVWRGRSTWTGLSGRYEVATTSAASGRLDRSYPPNGSADGPRVAAGVQQRPELARPGESSSRVQVVADWDALSKGDDPTLTHLH